MGGLPNKVTKSVGGGMGARLSKGIHIGQSTKLNGAVRNFSYNMGYNLGKGS
jgi:hypothetical protein